MQSPTPAMAATSSHSHHHLNASPLTQPSRHGPRTSSFHSLLRWLPSLLLLVLAAAAPATARTTATLAVTPSRLPSSGATVTVAWAGVAEPSPLDWVGLYCPADSPDPEFIGWLNMTQCGGWQSGGCQLELPLTNLRAAYHFRLFLGPSGATPLALNAVPVPQGPPAAVAGPVEFANYNEPQHVHLALTGVPSQMRVMFTTRDALHSSVQYGQSPAVLTSSAAAAQSTYRRGDMCEAPANTSVGWRDPGTLHDAVVKGLAPGMRYFYRVGSDTGGWSATFSFTTEEADPQETRGIVFGDMGVMAPYRTFERLQKESVLTMRHMLHYLARETRCPTFISHIGDISYARGYSWIWDEFMAFIQPAASQVPYHVVIGNHEYNWPAQPWNPPWAGYGHDGGGECGVPFGQRFHMPGSAEVVLGPGYGGPATRNVWYSWDAGLVHMVAISTENDFTEGSEQYAWLEADLRGVERRRTPYIVVQGHRPLYTSNHEKRDAGKRAKMQEVLEPLLVQHSVSLCLWGHVHKYERTCPLLKWQCLASNLSSSAPPPPVHAIVGMGGQDWQPSWDPLNDVEPIFPQPDWSLFRSEGYGFALLHATWDKLTLAYVADHDGHIHDYVEIPSPLIWIAPDIFRSRSQAGPRSNGLVSLLLGCFFVGIATALSILLMAAVIHHLLNKYHYGQAPDDGPEQAGLGRGEMQWQKVQADLPPDSP